MMVFTQRRKDAKTQSRKVAKDRKGKQEKYYPFNNSSAM